MVDFHWWEEFVGELPPARPKMIVRRDQSSVTYRTSKEHTITERAVPWPIDRWGRPYRPWEGHAKGSHVLHWSDSDYNRSGPVSSLEDAEAMAEQHPDRIQMVELRPVTWSGEGHQGTLQFGRQDSSEWRGVETVIVVVAPDVTPEEIASWSINAEEDNSATEELAR